MKFTQWKQFSMASADADMRFESKDLVVVSSDIKKANSLNYNVSQK